MTVLLLAALLAQASSPPAKPAIDVVLMVDVSHSVAFGLVKRDRTLVRGLGDVLAGAFEPGDTVRIGKFGDAIVLGPEPLRDAAAIRAAAAGMTEEIGGASPIWDALLAARSALADGAGPFDSAQGRRKGIILVTDGRSTGNREGFAEALEQLQRARIPVFVVSIDQRDDANPFPDPGARLIKLAEATGGTCLFVERPALAGAVTRALTALRARP